MDTLSSSAAKNLYGVLGITDAADAEEIRRAYRALARVLHPDVNDSPHATHEFAHIAAAYEVLSDPERKRAYDLSRRPTPRSDIHVPKMAQSPSPARGVLRGADVEVTLQLSLREAALGTRKEIELLRREVCVACIGRGIEKDGTSVRCSFCLGSGGTRTMSECSNCHGSGNVGSPLCRQCFGSGRRQGSSFVQLSIPAGVDTGQTLTLKGEGSVGPRNGPRGDVLVRIQVMSDPVLRRQGIDILMDLPVSSADALHGCHVEVPTLQGPKTLKVPPRTTHQSVVRMGGAGIRLPGSWHRGDQFVLIQIYESQ